MGRLVALIAWTNEARPKVSHDRGNAGTALAAFVIAEGLETGKWAAELTFIHICSCCNL